MEYVNINEKLHMAREGRLLWLAIVKDHGIDFTKLVIIMPHANDIINSYVIKHIKELKEVKRVNDVILILTESEAEHFKKDCISKSLKVEVVTDSQMLSLMKYNDLCTFSSQMLIVSFTYGSDCDARGLLSDSSITLEEAVCIGILGFPEYCEVEK